MDQAQKDTVLESDAVLMTMGEDMHLCFVPTKDRLAWLVMSCKEGYEPMKITLNTKEAVLQYIKDWAAIWGEVKIITAL